MHNFISQALHPRDIRPLQLQDLDSSIFWSFWN